MSSWKQFYRIEKNISGYADDGDDGFYPTYDLIDIKTNQKVYRGYWPGAAEKEAEELTEKLLQDIDDILLK